jgi:hypothetical protein
MHDLAEIYVVVSEVPPVPVPPTSSSRLRKKALMMVLVRLVVVVSRPARIVDRTVGSQLLNWKSEPHVNRAAAHLNRRFFSDRTIILSFDDAILWSQPTSYLTNLVKAAP